jgi:ABC-type phosphate transport system substrate-binding protein
MRPLLALALALALTLTAICATVSAESRSVTAYQVIVNPSNPSTVLDQSFVEDAFLKKTTHWSNDDVIRPADLVSNSAVRRKFTEDLLKRSVEAVKGYWQQRIFSGRDVPPPEFETDDDVVRYVLKYGGAIGYVSGGANLNGSKVVTVR